ncbi:hypothetical protein NE619_13670 [Anaerovorax odorimutans]|uniref:Uncharacterized protein n=2 Tax=Anaerovorax odorimutans TaxID=109327 RepID=A0ABT1RRI3_9FIRM|nr:hypothetical protein [Anaerovorax odorimutans]
MEEDYILINDNYRGLIRFDLKLNLMDNIALEEDVFIYSGFVCKHQAVLYCAENECIIYVDLKKRIQKKVCLPEEFNDHFCEDLQWDQESVDLISSRERWYRIYYFENRIERLSDLESRCPCYKRILESMDRGEMDFAANWKEGYGYKENPDQFVISSVFSDRTETLRKEAYQIYEKEGLLAGIGEKQIEIVYEGQKYLIRAKHGYYFSGFDSASCGGTRRIVVMQSDKKNCMRNWITLYGI